MPSSSCTLQHASRGKQKLTFLLFYPRTRTHVDVYENHDNILTLALHHSPPALCATRIKQWQNATRVRKSLREGAKERRDTHGGAAVCMHVSTFIDTGFRSLPQTSQIETPERQRQVSRTNRHRRPSQSCARQIMKTERLCCSSIPRYRFGV